MGMPHQEMGMGHWWEGYVTSADGHGTLVGGPLIWVCHISRWAWDTGGRAPNVGMPHQQMGMGHWWKGP